jgi:hypothetical protein
VSLGGHHVIECHTHGVQYAGLVMRTQGAS